LASTIPRDLILCDTARKQPDIVTRLAGIQQLPEHFDAGDDVFLSLENPTTATSSP
jgi:hypothetical protein